MEEYRRTAGASLMVLAGLWLLLGPVTRRAEAAICTVDAVPAATSAIGGLAVDPARHNSRKDQTV